VEDALSRLVTSSSISLPLLIVSQSVFLKDITSAYEKKQDLESLLFDDFFNKGTSIATCRGALPSNVLIPRTAVHKAQPGWRRVIAQAVLWGIPTPAFSTALAFFDGYRSEIVSANLIQAQVRHT
jgi:6-phosphogluconate dehydrogenase